MRFDLFSVTINQGTDSNQASIRQNPSIGQNYNITTLQDVLINIDGLKKEVLSFTGEIKDRDHQKTLENLRECEIKIREMAKIEYVESRCEEAHKDIKNIRGMLEQKYFDNDKTTKEIKADQVSVVNKCNVDQDEIFQEHKQFLDEITFENIQIVTGITGQEQSTPTNVLLGAQKKEKEVKPKSAVRTHILDVPILDTQMIEKEFKSIMAENQITKRELLDYTGDGTEIIFREKIDNWDRTMESLLALTDSRLHLVQNNLKCIIDKISSLKKKEYKISKEENILFSKQIFGENAESGIKSESSSTCVLEEDFHLTSEFFNSEELTAMRENTDVTPFIIQLFEKIQKEVSVLESKILIVMGIASKTGVEGNAIIASKIEEIGRELDDLRNTGDSTPTLDKDDNTKIKALCPPRWKTSWKD